jgi:hypothetical protein
MGLWGLTQVIIGLQTPLSRNSLAIFPSSERPLEWDSCVLLLNSLGGSFILQIYRPSGVFIELYPSFAVYGLLNTDNLLPSPGHQVSQLLDVVVPLLLDVWFCQCENYFTNLSIVGTLWHYLGVH